VSHTAFYTRLQFLTLKLESLESSIVERFGSSTRYHHRLNQSWDDNQVEYVVLRMPRLVLQPK
jgi:hypothetical protein